MTYFLTIFILMMAQTTFHKVYSYRFSVKYKIDIYPKAGKFSLDLKHLRHLKEQTENVLIKRKIGFIIFMESLSGYLFLLCLMSVLGISLFALL